MNILDKIIANKIKTIEKQKHTIKKYVLESSPYFKRNCISFSQTIKEK